MAAEDWAQYAEAPRTDAQAAAPAPSSSWDQYAAPSDKWAQYQDVKSKEPPAGFWDEFNANVVHTTDQALDLIKNDNLFVNIGHGIGRIAADIHDGGSVGDVLTKELHDVWNSDLKTVHNFDFKQFKDAVASHPGAVAASLVNSLVADPEMIVVPYGFGGKFADMASNSAKRLGTTVAKIAGIGGRAAESGVVGGALGAETAMAEQFKTGEYNLSDIAQQAEAGTAFGAAVGGLIGLKAPKEAGGLSMKEQADFVSAQADVAKAKPIEERTISDLIYQHSNEQVVNANLTAQKLLNSGASIKVVERVRKANPLVGSILDDMLAQRKAFTDKFNLNQVEPPVFTKSPQGMSKSLGAWDYRSTPEEKLQRPVSPAEADARVQAEMPIHQGPSNESATMWAKRESQLTGEAKKAQEQKWAEEEQMWADALTRDNAPSFIQKDGPKLGEELPPTQRGFTHPDIIKYLGLASAGAVGASMLDPQHPVGAAIIGGVAASSGLWALPKIGKAIKDMWKPMALGVAVGTYLDDQHRVQGGIVGAAIALGARAVLNKNAITDSNVFLADNMIHHELQSYNVYAHHIWAQRTTIERMVPSADSRNNISRYIDKSAHTPLTAQEKEVAKYTSKTFEDIGQAGLEAGVIKGLRDNYISHIIDWSGKTAKEVGDIQDQILIDLDNKTRNVSTTSRFGKARKYDTFDELNKVISKYGVALKTQDVAEILSIYGNSMRRAIMTKNIVESMKNMKDASGRPFLVPTDKPVLDANGKVIASPRTTSDYVSMDHYATIGMKAHPEVAPALGFILHNKSDAITNGLHAISMFSKRMAVVGNLFHARSLMDVAIGAGIPKIGFKSLISGIPGMSRYTPDIINIYRRGGNSDIDLLMRSGLQMGKPKDLDPEGVNSMAYSIGKAVDNALPVKVGAKLGQTVTKINNVFDQITWEHGWTGIKLSVAMKEMQRALEENAAAMAKDASVKPLSKEAAASMAAQYANDLTGGQDWFKMASSYKSAAMRKLAFKAISKQGSQWMQILMFAPDWTFSTFKSGYKGVASIIPGGKYLPGAPTEHALRRMYGRYIVLSALSYGILANTLNEVFTGHSILENTDPFRVELGNGQTMQLSKHSTEFPEWILHPSQVVLNKLGLFPSEVAEQLLHKDYLSATGKAPPIKNPFTHAARRFSPIPLQQLSGPGGVPGAVSSFLGSPIYGQTTSAKTSAAFEKKLQKSVNIKPIKLSDILKGNL